mmetsp:Transcript_60363/g.171589  ORF Transcript_60363/g.171589 Transcript_60363/m.171589 type:complete len:211 (-) Transcript_60363:396-1028(-)
MDGVHLGDLRQPAHQLGLVNVLRRLSHQSAHSANQRALCGEEHKDSEKHCAAGVRIVPLADPGVGSPKVEGLHPDAEGCQAYTEGLDDVADDVGDRRLHGGAALLPTVAVAVAASLVAVRVAMPQHLHEDEVDEEADDGDHEHGRRLDLLRADEAEHGLVHQDGSECPDQHHGQQCPQHLGLLEAIGVLLRCLHLRELQGQQRDDEAADV